MGGESVYELPRWSVGVVLTLSDNLLVSLCFVKPFDMKCFYFLIFSFSEIGVNCYSCLSFLFSVSFICTLFFKIVHHFSLKLIIFSYNCSKIRPNLNRGCYIILLLVQLKNFPGLQ